MHVAHHTNRTQLLIEESCMVVSVGAAAARVQRNEQAFQSAVSSHANARIKPGMQRACGLALLPAAVNRPLARWSLMRTQRSARLESK